MYKMGRDRRKRDRRQTADVVNANNSIEINTTTDPQTSLEPRGQREPRNRSGQERREVAVKKIDSVPKKSATEDLSGKKNETKEAPPDPTVLFANLKRETDDIKALTEKKFAKRQIFSNWSRYDEPLPDPVQEQELPGADFKALCANITSESNYFQLKSERSWDTNISELSSELFSLNADILAVSLDCIPFYERLDLPITLFSDTDIQRMKNSAMSCKNEYESSKPYFCKLTETVCNAEDNLPLKIEREKTPDHKPTLSFSIDGPDEFERSILTEVCEQAHSMPSRVTKFSADISRKGSPEIVSKTTSKIPETNVTSQDLRTNPLSPEKQESNVRGFKENTARHSAEISFNIISEKEERNISPKSFVEDRSLELVQKFEPLGKEIFEEINEDIPEKLNVTLQRPSMSPEIEKIKHFDNETNDASTEIFSSVVRQSDTVREKSVEESIPESIPETLPPRQMNKNKSKEKKKQRTLQMPTTSWTAADSEAVTPQREPELKGETETMSNIAVNKDRRPQKEVQKPSASAESLGQRSKKRRSKEKGQHVNKPVENIKMPTQEKPVIANALAEEKPKPLVQEIAVEKAKSPSPEEPFVKLHSAPQTKPAEIVKPKQEKVAEPVKVIKEKPVEKGKLKEKKTVQKVKSTEEKTIGKVKLREEKVKAPAQEKTVENIGEYDDLDFLLSLQKPIKVSQVTPGESTQVLKPSIEKEDTSAKPAGLIFPHEAQELEDWLDSVLND